MLLQCLSNKNVQTPRGENNNDVQLLLPTVCKELIGGYNYMHCAPGFDGGICIAITSSLSCTSLQMPAANFPAQNTILKGLLLCMQSSCFVQCITWNVIKSMASEYPADGIQQMEQFFTAKNTLLLEESSLRNFCWRIHCNIIQILKKH